MHYELYVGQPLVSDDAGQFKISGLLHALCWLHAERSIRKLVPLRPREQEAIDNVRDAVWKYYQRLRAYREAPTPRRKAALERDFDRLFRRRTGFADLNEALRRIHEKRDDLLLVRKSRCTTISRRATFGSGRRSGRSAPARAANWAGVAATPLSA